MNRITITLISIIVLYFLFSCEKQDTALKVILEKAGENKAELQKFLAFYKNDSLKYEAAKFLVVGMENRYTYDILVKDSGNNPVNLNLYQPTITRKNVVMLLDSLQYWVKDTIVEDLKTVKSDYLIQNLEQAFKMWQTKAWSKQYSFELFCEYVLPYRIGNESLNNNWRNYFQKKYLPMLDTLKGNDKVKRVFQLVKNDISKWYWYADNTIDLKPTMDLDEILSCHKGNCVDLANVYLYTLRAIGVAAAIDYIPLWGRTNYGHCELVYWDENNQPQRCQTEIGLTSPPPKVYRQYYSIRRNNQLDKIRDPNDIPPYLIEKTYRDVTSEYTKTSTVNINPEKEPESGILYLSVFNAGQWQPIAWSDSVLKQTGEFVFENIGRDIVYLPSVYSQQKTIPNGKPIIIDHEGRVKPLVPENGSLTSMTFPKKIINHKLHYWDNKWVNIGKGNILEDSLRFDNIPSNALYRLLGPNEDHRERVFTYENCQFKYW